MRHAVAARRPCGSADHGVGGVNHIEAGGDRRCSDTCSFTESLLPVLAAQPVFVIRDCRLHRVLRLVPSLHHVPSYEAGRAGHVRR